MCPELPKMSSRIACEPPMGLKICNNDNMCGERQSCCETVCGYRTCVGDVVSTTPAVNTGKNVTRNHRLGQNRNSRWKWVFLNFP